MERVIHLVDAIYHMNMMLIVTTGAFASGVAITAFISSPLPDYCKVTSFTTEAPIYFIWYLGVASSLLGSSVKASMSPHRFSKVGSFFALQRIVAYIAYAGASISLVSAFVLFPVVVQLIFGKFSCWGVVRKIMVIGGSSIGGLALLYYTSRPFAGRVTQDEKEGGKNIFVEPGQLQCGADVV